MNCIGVNYKKVPLEIRERYAFTAEEQREFHKRLKKYVHCAGSVIVSTCNRSEIYFCGEAERRKLTETEAECRKLSGTEAECRKPAETGAECRKLPGTEAERRKLTETEAECRKLPGTEAEGGSTTETALISDVEHELAAYKQLEEQEMLGQIYVYSGDAALRHLFHVTCGLDSMVLGEDEILRQVKDGYLLAQEEGAVCNEINIAFQGAMSCAKSIKTNTLLSKTPVSMGTLAANRIESFLQEHGGRKVLLVGITGQIGGILAKNLYSKGITEITGTSRHHGSAFGVGTGGNLRMVDFADRYRYVEEADVIVSATTGPHYTFVAQKLAEHLTTSKPRLLVDLAVPRDIDRAVTELAQCELADVDDFKRAAAHNNEIKLHETDKAELILAERLEETKKSIYMSEFMLRDGEVFAEWKDKSFGSVFYRLKDRMTAEQLKGLMEALTERKE